MRTISLAIQFLTTIRLPWRFEYSPEDFPRSLRWFFLPGLLIGGVQWLIVFGWSNFAVPSELCAVIVVIAGLILTGGLHLDGTGDTADGFGAGHDRESTLRIMRDPRLGAYGTAAIVLALYLKILALGSVMVAGTWNLIWIAPTLSRSLLACACTLLPYAREEGKGKEFSRGNFWNHALPSLFVSAAIGFSVLGIRFWIPLVVTFSASALFCLYSYARIRGFTGDTLGFQNELTEILLLFTFAPALI
jgi:adenosylcobinamide-GDP ribazoletransferase